MKELRLFLASTIKVGIDMSNDYYDYVMELIYQDIDDEDEKGLLDDKINKLAKEHSLHADDERDDIKVKIAEERLRESFYEWSN